MKIDDVDIAPLVIPSLLTGGLIALSYGLGSLNVLTVIGAVMVGCGSAFILEGVKQEKRKVRL